MGGKKIKKTNVEKMVSTLGKRVLRKGGIRYKNYGNIMSSVKDVLGSYQVEFPLKVLYGLDDVAGEGKAYFNDKRQATLFAERVVKCCYKRYFKTKHMKTKLLLTLDEDFKNKIEYINNKSDCLKIKIKNSSLVNIDEEPFKVYYLLFRDNGNIEIDYYMGIKETLRNYVGIEDRNPFKMKRTDVSISSRYYNNVKIFAIQAIRNQMINIKKALGKNINKYENDIIAIENALREYSQDSIMLFNNFVTRCGQDN